MIAGIVIKHASIQCPPDELCFASITRRCNCNAIVMQWLCSDEAFTRDDEPKACIDCCGDLL